MDKRLEELEKLVKTVEVEKDFDKVLKMFSAAAELVKQLIGESRDVRGRVLEIVRELDGYIEREIKMDEPC